MSSDSSGWRGLLGRIRSAVSGGEQSQGAASGYIPPTDSPGTAPGRLTDPETWRPLIDALNQHKPASFPTLGFSGEATYLGGGGTLVHAGGWNATSGTTEGAVLDLVHTVFDDCVDASGARSETGTLVVRADGASRTVLILQDDPRIEAEAGSPAFACVVLDREALPAYYRPIEPRPDAPAAPEVDVPALIATLDAELKEKKGASSQLLARTEKKLGTPLTEELRALYTLANGGCNLDDDDDVDDDPWMLDIIPLNATNQDRKDFTFSPGPATWRLDADEVVRADEAGRTQPTAGSSYWFPFASDGGGSYWAVDLAPGPNGYLGQVLFLDNDEGWRVPHVVATSVTDFVLNRRGYPDADERDETAGRVVVSATSRRRNARCVASLAEADLDNVEVLWIDGSVPPQDLGPLKGRSRLRTLDLEAPLANPRQLLDLPGLQYLAADLGVWESLLEAQAVPSTLAAAGFHADADSSWPRQIAVINRLLGSRGQEHMAVQSVTVPAMRRR